MHWTKELTEEFGIPRKISGMDKSKLRVGCGFGPKVIWIGKITVFGIQQSIKPLAKQCERVTDSALFSSPYIYPTWTFPFLNAEVCRNRM